MRVRNVEELMLKVSDLERGDYADREMAKHIKMINETPTEALRYASVPEPDYIILRFLGVEPVTIEFEYD